MLPIPVTSSLIVTALVSVVGAAPLTEHPAAAVGGCASDTVPHRQKRYALLPYTYLWPTNKPVTISVLNSPHGFTVSDIEDMALDCARMWAQRSGVYFQLAAEGYAGDIDIMFIRIDGPGHIVGFTSGPHPGLSVPMFLDMDEQWIKDKSLKETGKESSLKWALCHEMGHNLGLGHSNVYPPTYMSALHWPTFPENWLQPDDIKGAQRLYGRSNGWSVWPGRAKPKELNHICIVWELNPRKGCTPIPKVRRQSPSREATTTTTTTATTTTRRRPGYQQTNSNKSLNSADITNTDVMTLPEVDPKTFKTQNYWYYNADD